MTSVNWIKRSFWYNLSRECTAHSLSHTFNSLCPHSSLCISLRNQLLRRVILLSSTLISLLDSNGILENKIKWQLAAVVIWDWHWWETEEWILMKRLFQLWLSFLPIIYSSLTTITKIVRTIQFSLQFLRSLALH